MTASKQQDRKVETTELSDAELGQVTGGIIAVLRQATQMCDGSVAPAPTTAQSQRGIIAI
ncbi:MAG TPA: hypothetical protein VHA35_04630 [Dongiaceae bacterium]|nr:hypothetical protein [Dongiaceae bacterium]